MNFALLTVTCLTPGSRSGYRDKHSSSERTRFTDGSYSGAGEFWHTGSSISKDAGDPNDQFIASLCYGDLASGLLYTESESHFRIFSNSGFENPEQYNTGRDRIFYSVSKTNEKHSRYGL